MVKYYLDTCIWIDFFEDRKGAKEEPFGVFASKLLIRIQKGNHSIIISDHLLDELYSKFSLDSVESVWESLGINMEKTFRALSQGEEADKIAKERMVPYGRCIAYNSS